MIHARLSRTALLTLAVGLVAAAPATAGGVLSVDGTTLVYAGDDSEPNNVTFEREEGSDTIVVTENGSRMTLGETVVTVPGGDADGGTTGTGTSTTPADPTAPDGAGTTPAGPPPSGAICTLDDDRYVARCTSADWIERIRVTTSDAGSDVRIRADLPAEITGGDGDDLLIGGPGDDVIEGGDGMDVIGGGGGADELHGGRDDDLLTYVDRIRRNGELLARRGGVTVAPGDRGESGSRGEDDTVYRDFEQFEGGAGNDRFELRDGDAQSVACNAGRDVAVLDPRDDAATDCERSHVGAAPGERMTTPTLVFPFPDRRDRGRSTVTVKPRVPLRNRAIVLTIRCQVAIGLLAADGPGCRGRVRMTRGGVEMAERTIQQSRGRSITWRVPLSSSLSLARRAGGLPVTVTALPSRGEGVRRDLRFTVKG